MNLANTRIAMWKVAVIGLGLVAVLIGCRRQPRQSSPETGQTGPNSVAGTVGSVTAGPTLDEVIAARKTWDVAFRSYVGKPVPDFTVTDLAGQTHSIGSLKGKDVLITVWAPWCPPCRMEIPDLAELRRTVPESDLAILAISFLARDNTEQMVRQFVEKDARINYTVSAVARDAIPEPFSAVEAIPSAFFIGKDGVLRLATVGVVPLADMLAIIRAR